MGYNFKNIIEGWSKSLGLYEATEEDKQLSKKRLSICAECEHATASSLLKFVRGGGHEIKTLVCNKCPSNLKCPVNEKTLVKGEKCPIGNW